jgi:hypothetical protein
VALALDTHSPLVRPRCPPNWKVRCTSRQKCLLYKPIFIDLIDEASLLINWTGASKSILLALMKSAQDHIALKSITTIKHVLPVCFLLAAGLLLSACKQEARVASGGDLTGVYALVTVNGNQMPASISHEGTSLQVRSGTFTIKADGTCGTKTVFVPPSGSELAREVSATYTKDGSKLTMQWQGAGTTTGTVQGNTFTMDNEGMVFVYKK